MHQPWTWAITGFGERQTHISFWVGEISGAVANAKSSPRPTPLGRDHVVPVLEAAVEVVAGENARPSPRSTITLMVVADRLADRRLDLVGHRRHHRVELLGPVPRDGRDRPVCRG